MTISETLKKSNVTYDRFSPFPAKVLHLRRLNKPGSSKEVLHVELDLSGSEISYKVGSSFALFPENDDFYVSRLLDLLSLTGTEVVQDPKTERELYVREFFQKKANLSRITSHHLRLIGGFDSLLEDKEALKSFLEQNNLYSLLAKHKKRPLPLQELVEMTPPLLPRYYSIASSQTVAKGHVHLMVASFYYEEAGEEKKSITASFLEKAAQNPALNVPLFLQDNPSFSLPLDPSTPIIMIGPGTGLAAFRGFIQERIHQNAPGKNWLFTGAQRREFDFYYEEEFTSYVESNKLILDLAFSRDQEEKIYVQHRMLEKQALLWDWIERQNGALYISGDAKKMAKDVQHTLEQIAMQVGYLSEEEAKHYLKTLRKEKRLHLDVY